VQNEAKTKIEFLNNIRHIYLYINRAILTCQKLTGLTQRYIFRSYSLMFVFVEIKCQLDATVGFFIADLIACLTRFGHHYAHHQELKSIIQVVAACGIWCFGFQVAGLV